MPSNNSPLRDRRPLTILLRDQIQAILTEDKLGPGDRVPTEAQLATRFDVARTTVRESLKLLEQEGYIISRHGVGRFVASPPSLVRPLSRLEGVTDMLAAHGKVAEGRLIQRDTIDPDETVQEMLGGKLDDQPVVRLVRSRSDGVNVLVYSIDYFVDPAGSTDGSDFDGTGSLFSYLASVGTTINSATCDLSSVLLDADTSDQLGTKSTQPWLLMVQQHFSTEGKPVLYSLDYHAGPDFSFRIVRTR